MRQKPSVRRMKQIRKKELYKAARLLHIKRVFCLGLPDGGLEKYAAAFLKKTLSLTQKIHPEIIMSFGPDGISGHRDHIAAGIVAKHVAQKIHCPLIVFTLSGRVSKRAKAFLVSRRKNPHYVPFSKIRFVKPNTHISINARIKQRALRAHASQMDDKNAFTGFPAFAVEELLQREHFFVRV